VQSVRDISNVSRFRDCAGTGALTLAVGVLGFLIVEQVKQWSLSDFEDVQCRAPRCAAIGLTIVTVSSVHDAIPWASFKTFKSRPSYYVPDFN
jgi:hypothetical protein